MVATSILFILLLSMASVLFYCLAGWILKKFFQLHRKVFYSICIAGTAIFFAAVCAGGVFALQSLRGAEYARGLADGTAVTSSEMAAQSEKEENLAWQDGYSEGYSAGFSAASIEDETLSKNSAEASGQADAVQDTQNEATDVLEETPAPDGADTPDITAPASDGETETGTEPPADAIESSGETSPNTISSGTIVYYTENGSVLHRDRNCSYLARAKEVLACDAAEAPDLPFCSRCG